MALDLGTEESIATAITGGAEQALGRQSFASAHGGGCVDWDPVLGTEVVVWLDDGEATNKLRVSHRDGGSWTEYAGPTPVGTIATNQFAGYVDASGVLWLSYYDSGEAFQYVARGEWNGSGYDWELGEADSNQLNAATDLVIIAAPHPGSADDVILVGGQVSATRRVAQIDWDSGTGFSGWSFFISSVGSGGFNGIKLVLETTTDGKTASGTPRFWTAYGEEGGDDIQCQRIAWNGSAYVGGSHRTLDSDGEADPLAVGAGWDPVNSRLIVAGKNNTADRVRLISRNAADTTTTVIESGALPTPPSNYFNGGASFNITVDPATGDVYLLAIGDATTGTDAGSVYQLLWDGSWDTTWYRITEVDDVDDGTGGSAWVFKPVHHAIDGVAIVWGISSELNFNKSLQFNQPPTAPTIDSPPDGTVKDVNSSLFLDWTFNDPDPGDTQGAYSIRRRIGVGSYNYWNGSTWQASEDASTKISSAGTNQSFTSGWGADGDDDHYYSVKTWDAADEGPSAWSSETRIIPSAQDNPTITAPTGTVDPTETATWTVSTQTKYRIVVSDDSSTDIDAGTLEYDSGIVVSASTSQLIEFPTNSVTRYVKLQTWNDEGLASDVDVETVTVSYTPPATPTVSLSTVTNPGAITLTITNPGTGATEEDNDVYRRVSGDTGPGIRIATGVAVDGTYVDWIVASGVTYEYKIVAFATNGSQAQGAWT